MNNPNNRPLGTNEKVFWALDQKSSTHFAIAAELKGNATDQAWRDAIDLVQTRHPNLSMRITGNSYHTAALEHVNGSKIPLRIVYTKPNEDWSTIVTDELNEPFDLSLAPLVRAVLIQQSGKTIFIFVANHSISDGMSVALVIRDILNVISGQTIASLTAVPSLDEIIGVELIASQSENVTDHPGLPQPLTRKKTSISSLSLSKTETEALIRNAKSEHTTVHGALGAALVMALRNEPLQKETVRIMHPVSARKTLKMGEDFSLLLNIVTSSYPPSSHTFWDLARQVRQHVALTQDAGWIKNDTLATQQLFNSNLSIETILQALAAGTAHEVMLTNLGELCFETTYGPLQLIHIWGPMVLTPHPDARTVGVATFNGELTLTVTGLFESPDLLESVREILEQACLINTYHHEQQ